MERDIELLCKHYPMQQLILILHHWSVGTGMQQ